MVELAAVALELGAGIEDLAESILHDGDLLADADSASQSLLDVGGSRKMIGMDVGFEYPFELQPVLRHVVDERVGRVSAGAPGSRIVVENRIDDGAYVARRIARDIAHGVGCFIEKAL